MDTYSPNYKVVLLTGNQYILHILDVPRSRTLFFRLSKETL